MMSEESKARCKLYKEALKPHFINPVIHYIDVSDYTPREVFIAFTASHLCVTVLKHPINEPYSDIGEEPQSVYEKIRRGI